MRSRREQRQWRSAKSLGAWRFTSNESHHHHHHRRRPHYGSKRPFYGSSRKKGVVNGLADSRTKLFQPLLGMQREGTRDVRRRVIKILDFLNFGGLNLSVFSSSFGKIARAHPTAHACLIVSNLPVEHHRRQTGAISLGPTSRKKLIEARRLKHSM